MTMLLVLLKVWTRLVKLLLSSGRVRVCDVCPCPDTGTGTGTGTSISFPCCTTSLPSTVHASLTVPNQEPPGIGTWRCLCSGSGSLPVTYNIPLVYNSSSGKWEGTQAWGTCGRNLTLSLYCLGVGIANMKCDIFWSDSCDTVGNPKTVSGNPSADTCSPLHFTVFYSQRLLATCCQPSGNNGAEFTAIITL